jgi:hypothetical protein
MSEKLQNCYITSPPAPLLSKERGEKHAVSKLPPLIKGRVRVG